MMSASIADGFPHPGVDFQYCGISRTAVRTFHLQNPNSQPVRFEVQTDSQCPFIISPKSGKLLYVLFKRSSNALRLLNCETVARDKNRVYP
jgi:hypothetical protein